MSQKKRSIFEEVDAAPAPAKPAATGLIDRHRQGARGLIRLWLMTLFALLVVMIAVGGLTRLTDSGLSITEWQPVSGALPPLDQASWETEFEKYKQIPEYTLQNEGMTLSEFKVIFWWEWGHRQLGRVIGLVWAVGFFGFLAARQIPQGWTGRLLLLGALGGLQGFIGWWMVSSGLSGDRIDVASYRLATHLGLAFGILGIITWYVLRLGRDSAGLMKARRSRDARLCGLSNALLIFLALQILLGALVAGIDAGRSYTDWPLMAGKFFPESALSIEPMWRNFFENPALVQFMHRMAGYGLFIFGLIVWRAGRRSAHRATGQAFDWMMVMMFGQMVLGIGTVLYGAPWQIAIVHQLGAVVLWVLILRARFLSQYPLEQSLRGKVT